jgi:LemA protein
VKGYAAHEKEVFERVADARGRLAGATTPQEASAANAGLTSALGRLLAISENYPDLKANENFIRLQDELAGSENRIATERMRYNETVRVYNTHVKSFPANLIAGFFGFKEKDYFEAEAGAKEVPKVKF